MSMSTSIVGFVPPDDKFKAMKAVWDVCSKANVEIPEEVSDFFQDETPNDNGVSIDLEDHECVKEISEESVNGFEVDISMLPKDVKIIRFSNCY